MNIHSNNNSILKETLTCKNDSIIGVLNDVLTDVFSWKSFRNFNTPFGNTSCLITDRKISQRDSNDITFLCQTSFLHALNILWNFYGDVLFKIQKYTNRQDSVAEKDILSLLCRLNILANKMVTDSDDDFEGFPLLIHFYFDLQIFRIRHVTFWCHWRNEFCINSHVVLMKNRFHVTLFCLCYKENF